ncbi:type IV pilin protein [Amphritea sp. 2_MG-2023]|uniref:type IV pilin protein n=1 Tax=Amphritea TaxID=515417 RepID=UPI0026E372CD|nr:type IV pilin protein [Amphritea sp. 2_MG-2023]MDO6420320.1 type IV pilin protein [Amphritea sp. 2_MG-2023]MDX2421282.1 type IV pilin protein [Amphritea sp.]
MAAYSKGFTLIELMITIAIIGILASIAYPSYMSYIVDGRRTDAQEAMLSFANAMERHKTETMSYIGAADGGADTGVPNGVVFPSQAPVDSANKFYNLTIVSSSSLAYTLRATPIAGTSQATDGYLEITSTGLRRWDQNNDGDTSDADETSW